MAKKSTKRNGPAKAEDVISEVAEKLYVYCTLSNDQEYVTYGQSVNGVPQAERRVRIKGEANITDKHFVTPQGAVTPISAEDLVELKANRVFQLHMQNGFIKVDSVLTDIDKGVSDLEGRDQSAPLVEEDLQGDAELKK